MQENSEGRNAFYAFPLSLNCAIDFLRPFSSKRAELERVLVRHRNVQCSALWDTSLDKPGDCTEALQMIIDYCFQEKGFTVLWGSYFPSNPALGRVMEKCGFVDTGEETLCPNLEVGSDRPVRVMKIENHLTKKWSLEVFWHGKTRINTGL